MSRQEEKTPLSARKTNFKIAAATAAATANEQFRNEPTSSQSERKSTNVS